MEEKKSIYEHYCRITHGVFHVLNFICVVGLFVEIFAVSVMVVGRYVFNSVPIWTEQLSTMALAWMSVVAIAVGLYDESHMRVEVFDNIFPLKVVTFLKYMSNIAIIIFSILMIKYGYVIIELTFKVKLSGFKVSTSLLYIPLLICGVGSIYMSIFCMIRRYMEGKSNDN